MATLLKNMLMTVLFWSLEFRVFEFVSDFELRYSDLSCNIFKIPSTTALHEALPQSGRPQVTPSKGVYVNIYSSNPNIEARNPKQIRIL